MNWRTSMSLITLISQVNRLAPKRSTANDGTIGDVAHAARKSDHNPNARGVVCAMDITNDPARGCDAGAIAESLRLVKEPRISYVIWSGRMFSSYPAHGVDPYTWRPYTGADPHEHHVHISVRDEIADDFPWTLSKGGTHV